MFEMPDKLKERVVANYKASLLRQIYKIVLQIEGLGNPAGLVRGLGAGVRDFVMLPAKGALAPFCTLRAVYSAAHSTHAVRRVRAQACSRAPRTSAAVSSTAHGR